MRYWSRATLWYRTREKLTLFVVQNSTRRLYAARIGNTAYATNHRVPTADYEVVVVTARGDPPFASVFFSFASRFFLLCLLGGGVMTSSFTLSVLSVSYQ